MKVINIQQAFVRKINRQKKLAKYSDKAEFHCGGNCFHIGKISPGCIGCFCSGVYTYSFFCGKSFGLPDVCNRNCVQCFTPSKQVNTKIREIPREWVDFVKQNFNRKINYLLEDAKKYKDNHIMYVFTGFAEPLLYMPIIKLCMNYIRNEVEKTINKRVFFKLYTNGTLLDLNNILQLKELGLDEIRVNVTADNFSEEVYDNMRIAVKHIPIVTVEVPLWEPYRKGLFEMLPIIDDIGVKHLDLCAVEIWNKEAYDRISKALPDAEVYQAGVPLVIDDKGLAEELMKEVIDKNYSYSVIDCNGFVKQMYHPSGRGINKEIFGNSEIFERYNWVGRC